MTSRKLPLRHIAAWAAVTAMPAGLFGCKRDADPPRAKQAETVDALGGLSGVPLPAARWMRQASLAVRHMYPALADLDAVSAGQLDATQRVTQYVNSDDFVDVATSWFHEWMALPSNYAFFNDHATPTLANANNYGFFFFTYLDTTQQTLPLYGGGANPYFIPLGADGNYDTTSPAYQTVGAKLFSVAVEPTLLFRDIVRSDGDFRRIVNDSNAIRSTSLEQLYYDRDHLGDPTRQARDITQVGTPVTDPLATAIASGAGTGTWYRVPSLRGATGVLTTEAFLNTKLNGRTRSNHVGRTWLCSDVFLSDTTGYTPPACDPAVEGPRCDVVSHVQPTCAQCHISLDGMARGWERYWYSDFPSSQFFDAGNGPLGGTTDPSGHYLNGNAPLFADGTPFNDVAGLGALVAADARFPACIVRRVFKKLIGRTPVSPDEDALNAQLISGFSQSWSMRSLVLQIINSPAFRNR